MAIFTDGTCRDTLVNDYIPLGIAGSVLGLIPCLGALLSLAVAIYSIILAVRAIKVNYQFTTGRAVGAYFIPVAVIFAVSLPCE